MNIDMDYYMATGKHEPLTRVVIEHYDKRYILETPYSDSNLLEDLLSLTYNALLAAGYHQDTINQALVEMAEEKGFKINEEN